MYMWYVRIDSLTGIWKLQLYALSIGKVQRCYLEVMLFADLLSPGEGEVTALKPDTFLQLKFNHREV